MKTTIITTQVIELNHSLQTTATTTMTTETTPAESILLLFYFKFSVFFNIEVNCAKNRINIQHRHQ